MKNDSYKCVVITGAGATLSEAMTRPLKERPPLDRGFFRHLNHTQYHELKNVSQYLRDIYAFDPTDDNRDSLEEVLGILYSDLHNPGLRDRARVAFISLLKIFSRRLEDTTNTLFASNQGNLYRMLTKWLDCEVDITVITFNQDLQIEKTLEKLEKTKKWTKERRIFNFPFCYGLSKYRLSDPYERSKGFFDVGNKNASGIRVLKLHGSFNWYSRHTSQMPSVQAILNPKSELFISRHSKIQSNFRVRGEKNTYLFPLVVPPIVYKAGILHRQLLPIWEEAYESIVKANEIAVFGYSCPKIDYESANMISRAIKARKRPPYFAVVDPSPATFQRYVELTDLKCLHFYRNPKLFPI